MTRDEWGMLTPRGKQCAVAKACGWYQLNGAWIHPEGYAKSVPDYLCDLNAMHAAEEILTIDDWAAYEYTLDSICGEGNDSRWGAVNATAEQRAEAFVLTRGG